MPVNRTAVRKKVPCQNKLRPFQLPYTCRSPNAVHVFSLHSATRQTMYVLRNTVARSHYHCCSANVALLCARAAEPRVTVSSIEILSTGYQIFYEIIERT